MTIDEIIPYEEALAAFQKKYILEAAEAAGGNQCRAAEAAGLHRNTFSRIASRVGVDTSKLRKKGKTRRFYRRPS